MLSNEDNVCWNTIAGHLAEGSDASTAAIVAEQVLVGPAGSEGGEAVSKEVLHKAWMVERELERRLLGGEVQGLSCVAGGARGGCATSSPTAWWSTEGDLLGDTDVHKTLSSPHPSPDSALELPLTLASTLVGPVRDRHGHLRGADFLAITFYLKFDPASLNPGQQGKHSVLTDREGPEAGARLIARQLWRRAVREVVGGKGWQTQQVQLGKVGPTSGSGQRVIVKVS